MKKNALQQTPRFTMVGAGRLGTALAVALSRRGYAVETIIGRRLPKARKSAALLDVPVKVLAAKEIAKLELSDLTIIAVPDDQIESVAAELSKLNGSSTVLHTSGALSSGVLVKLAMKGWQTGSIHPLVSVSDAASGAKDLEGANWCIEGTRPAVRTARKLISDLGGRSFSIDNKVKPLYHAAAVMTAGSVVALFDVAVEMLTKCGVERREALRVLLPLLESSVTNLTRSDTPQALTGTFARGDVATVRRHIQALSENKLEDAEELYRLLGLRSLKLSKENGLDRELAQRITVELTSAKR